MPMNPEQYAHWRAQQALIRQRNIEEQKQAEKHRYVPTPKTGHKGFVGPSGSIASDREKFAAKNKESKYSPTRGRDLTQHLSRIRGASGAQAFSRAQKKYVATLYEGGVMTVDVFADAVEEFGEYLEGWGSEVYRHYASCILAGLPNGGGPGLFERTPFSTGKARNNWQVGIGAIPAGILSAQPDRAKEQLQRIALATIGEDIFITNNVPYIAALDAGYSPQNRHGIVAPTMRMVNTYFSTGFIDKIALGQESFLYTMGRGEHKFDYQGAASRESTASQLQHRLNLEKATRPKEALPVSRQASLNRSTYAADSGSAGGATRARFERELRAYDILSLRGIKRADSQSGKADPHFILGAKRLAKALYRKERSRRGKPAASKQANMSPISRHKYLRNKRKKS